MSLPLLEDFRALLTLSRLSSHWHHRLPPSKKPAVRSGHRGLPIAKWWNEVHNRNKNLLYIQKNVETRSTVGNKKVLSDLTPINRNLEHSSNDLSLPPALSMSLSFEMLNWGVELVSSHFARLQLNYPRDFVHSFLHLTPFLPSQTKIEVLSISSQIVSWIIYPAWNQPSFNNPCGRPEASKLPEAPVGQDPHGQ